MLPAVWPACDPSVLVVTALHNQPCSYPRGDHLNFLSVVNKQVRLAAATRGVQQGFIVACTCLFFLLQRHAFIKQTWSKEASGVSHVAEEVSVEYSWTCSLCVLVSVEYSWTCSLCLLAHINVESWASRAVLDPSQGPCVGNGRLHQVIRRVSRCVSATLAQDYARLHGYPIVATAIVADPTLPNSWNKIGWLLRAYRVPSSVVSGGSAR